MINIVLSSDDKYIPYCVTTILSIVSNNEPCSFYIISEFLSEASKQKLSDVVKLNGSEVHIVDIPSTLLDTFPMPQSDKVSHISIATYYRLFVAELLPQPIDKIIYLDCDIIVRKSLDELWNINLDGYALGAVYQINPEANERCYGLEIPVCYGYFNAGVLLINLNYWREHHCLEEFLEFVKKNSDKILYHDQDVLNAVLYKNTKRLSCKWNMTTNMFGNSIFYIDEKDNKGQVIRTNEDYKKTIKVERSNPTIIHYAAMPKPWLPHCFHPWRNEYRYYYRRAGYNIKESSINNIHFYIRKVVCFLRFDLLKKCFWGHQFKNNYNL